MAVGAVATLVTLATNCTLAEQLACDFGSTGAGGTWSQCDAISGTDYEQRATHWCMDLDDYQNWPITGDWERSNGAVSIAMSCWFGSVRNHQAIDIVHSP